jgi:hypothetical protein
MYSHCEECAQFWAHPHQPAKHYPRARRYLSPLPLTKMKLLTYLFTISTIFFISGCQSTGVIPMDQDSYMIGKKDGSPGLGVSLTNKAEVYREANDFCRAKGLEVLTLQVTTTPARPAQLGSTELHFKCVAPGGTAQPLQKSPDTVIEIRK